MSCYKDFLNDLPKRIKILLKRHYNEEKNIYIDSFEVTLLLSLSMPLFTTNVEMIKNEPVVGENVKTKVNASKDVLLKGISDQWECGVIRKNVSIYDLEIQNVENRKPIQKSGKDMFTFLKEIRNGLSHAGIRFFEGKSKNIDLILLRSAINMKDLNEGFNILIIPVEDYKLFLNNWCNFLIKERFNIADLFTPMENEHLYFKTGTDD